MNEELMKKAYLQFGGVWPQGAKCIVAASSSNNAFNTGHIDIVRYSYSTDFISNNSWDVVFENKQQFEAYGASLEREWMPDPDSMCEIKHDNEILGWKRAKYIGVNTDGSKVYAVVFLPYLSEYKNYKLDDNLKFRPLKNERQKFIDQGVNDLAEMNPEGSQGDFLGLLFDKGYRKNDDGR